MSELGQKIKFKVGSHKSCWGLW